MKKLLVCLALLLAPSVASAELIINGNFEAGNTGFTTNYLHTPGALGAQQSYDVLSNPFPAHPSAASYGDHTTGTGLMMAINESTTPNQLIWSQTVPVNPTTDYLFSGHVSSWVSAAPAQVDVLFNGSLIGTIQAPSTTAVWVPFTASWNSGFSSSLTIELRNKTHADVGGDFALDDLSLVGPAAVPAPATVLLVLPGGVLLAVFWLRRRQGGRRANNRPQVGLPHEGRPMKRLLACAGALLITTLTALADKVPEPKDGVFRKGWDKPLDPAKVCKFTYAKDALTIEVPAKGKTKGYDLNYLDYAKSQAPRLLKSVEGDFLIEVRVKGQFKTAGKDGPLVAAGLIVAIEGKPGSGAPETGIIDTKMSYVRLEFGEGKADPRKGRDGKYVAGGQAHFRAFGSGSTYTSNALEEHWEFPKNCDTVYMRLRRKGAYLFGEVSPDGKEWKWFVKPGIGLKESAKVKVGVFARSTSEGKFKVTFDQFKLTPLKPKDK